MALVLIILFLLLNLNRFAASVQIIESNDSDVSIINNAVYKVLQACSKNDVHRISVIQRSNPIAPFIPYKWNLSNTLVIYDHNSKNLFRDMRTHPMNFHVIVLYEFHNESFKKGWLRKLKKYLPSDRFVKFIAVTFDSSDCIAPDTAHMIATRTRKDYVLHICKNEFSQRVDIWTMNPLQRSEGMNWYPRANGTKKVMSFSMHGMDHVHIDTCDSIFYYQKNFIRRNAHYTVTYTMSRAIVKPYPPLMTFQNDGTVVLSPVDESHSIEQFNVSQTKWTLFGGYDGKVFATIFPLLRSEMTVFMYPEINEKNSTLIDWSKMMRNVKSHGSIILNSRDWTFKLPSTSTFIYPRVQKEIRVITQRVIVPKPVRIREIFNVYIIISAMIISGLFILAQRYLDGRSFGNAALDAYSLILGLGIPKLPNTLASRIFFGSLIFYFIILCTYFQGSVTQIMTVPLVTANVDSLEDLEASGYTVYAGRSTDKDFELFRKHFTNFVEYPGDRCIEVVLSDPRAACIDEGEYLQDEILKHNNLHLVKEPIKTFYTTYLVNGRWDYKDRFEILFTRLSESGILQKWQKDIENLSKIQAQIRELREDREDAPMTLENWKIFFIVLYSGLLISIIVWILEILHARKFN